MRDLITDKAELITALLSLSARPSSHLSLAALALCAGLWGCDGEDAPSSAGSVAGAMAGGAEAGAEAGVMNPTPLEIIGTYTDESATTHEITAEAWTITYPGSAPSRFWIEEVSNEDQALFAHNDAVNEYSPNLYSRFDWVVLQGELWFCQTSYDAASLEVARETPRADSSDPATSGCNTFPWSKLSPTP